MPCPCDNPDCTLPAGRCYLCGNPVLHASTSGTEVCAACVGAVEAAYQAERLPHAVTTPGWLVVELDDGVDCVQADDDMNRFENDEEAAEHVRRIVKGEAEPEPYGEDSEGSCLAGRASTAERLVHCPQCATERGVAIPAACPHVAPVGYPTLRLDVPAEAWTICGANPDDPEDGRLLATLYILGTPHHLEALRVKTDDAGCQVGADPASASRLGAFQDEYETGFETVQITLGGVTREYVLVVAPHGF